MGAACCCLLLGLARSGQAEVAITNGNGFRLTAVTAIGSSVYSHEDLYPLYRDWIGEMVDSFGQVTPVIAILAADREFVGWYSGGGDDGTPFSYSVWRPR